MQAVPDAAQQQKTRHRSCIHEAPQRDMHSLLQLPCQNLHCASPAAEYLCAGERLRKLPGQALSSIWWPFTQHAHMAPGKVLTIDARAGEQLLVASDPNAPAAAAPASHAAAGQEAARSPRHMELRPHYDACCSWWTQVGLTDVCLWLLCDTLCASVGQASERRRTCCLRSYMACSCRFMSCTCLRLCHHSFI